MLKLICLLILVLACQSFLQPRYSRKMGSQRIYSGEEGGPKKIKPIVPKVKPITPQKAERDGPPLDVWEAAEGSGTPTEVDPTSLRNGGALPSETPEEQYKREKLAEIAERKAAEVFVTRSTGKYECQACGYVYSVEQGYEKRGIAPGTAWADIEKFRCPSCGANKKYFIEETETLSGFKENLNYGFGTNALTGDQKGGLIYGGLFLGFLVFMSGYLLE